MVGEQLRITARQTIRLSGIYIRAAFQWANGAGVHRLQSVEEEREQSQAECERAFVPNNVALWDEVRDRLNQKLKGWKNFP
jgi:hypothetical protein